MITAPHQSSEGEEQQNNPEVISVHSSPPQTINSSSSDVHSSPAQTINSSSADVIKTYLPTVLQEYQHQHHHNHQVTGE